MGKKREIIDYIFWGILSSLLNVGLFQSFLFLGLDYRVANIITLFLVKIFCYFTNKLFVFRTPYKGLKILFKEILSFVIARGATFILDLAGVMLLVEVIKIDAFISKCIMTVVVVLVNYLLSKRYVFKK